MNGKSVNFFMKSFKIATKNNFTFFICHESLHMSVKFRIQVITLKLKKRRLKKRRKVKKGKKERGR